MRTLIAALVLLSACSRTAEHLVGKWEFDPATYELVQRFRALSPDEQRHWIETATMNLTITSETIVWEQKLPGWGSMSARGSYRVLETEGRRITIEADLNPKRRLVFTVDENQLRFGLGGRSIILRRKAG